LLRTFRYELRRRDRGIRQRNPLQSFARGCGESRACHNGEKSCDHCFVFSVSFLLASGPPSGGFAQKLDARAFCPPKLGGQRDRVLCDHARGGSKANLVTMRFWNPLSRDFQSRCPPNLGGQTALPKTSADSKPFLCKALVKLRLRRVIAPLVARFEPVFLAVLI
jgi:hypothetical protein